MKEPTAVWGLAYRWRRGERWETPVPAPPSSAEDLAATVPRWALWMPVLFAVGIAVYFEMHVKPPPLVLDQIRTAGLAHLLAI